MRSLLIVGTETPALHRVVPLLLRSEFEIHRSPSSDEVRDLIASRRFDLILARHPLAGPPLADLVALIRQPGAPCRDSSLLLLAEPGAVHEVGSFLGHGVNRIVSLDAPSDRLLHAVAELLAVPPRKTARAIVQLELWVRHGSTRLLSITENISLTGMLVRGGRELPIGSRLRFELTLPGIPPVQGEVEVVRHTDATAEYLDGAGLRFESFQGDGLQRLRSFLERGH